MLMLWVKAFHIIFVVTWFAGLFYLPRLFVRHVEAPEAIVRERLTAMERGLLGITHIGGTLAVAFGIALLVLIPGYLHQAWLHAKLTLVLLLIAYHACLVKFARDLRAGSFRRSSRWLRWFNEVPALLLIGIVVLVVVKPF
jgi:protoporphyrinogen IX oxidase